MKILIDLDGTILDSRKRLYSLFKALVPECVLGINAYWALKRDKITHKKILLEHYGYSHREIEIFELEWLKKIEMQEFLNMDIIHPGTYTHIQMLSKMADLYLLTARQYPDMVDSQLNRFKIRNFFKKIYVTRGKLSKNEVVIDLKLSNEDWIIGDTGYDIEVGKKLGVRTASVTNGFLNKKSLLIYKPDLILETFTDFIPKL
jgi:phosphoglycolate phosphatase